MIFVKGVLTNVKGNGNCFFTSVLNANYDYKDNNKNCDVNEIWKELYLYSKYYVYNRSTQI